MYVLFARSSTRIPKEASVVVIEVMASIPAMNYDISNAFFAGKSGSCFAVMSPKNTTYKATRIMTASNEKKTVALSRKYNKILRLANASILIHNLSINGDKYIIQTGFFHFKRRDERREFY